MTKKIAIIGGGTAGVMAAAHFKQFTDCEIQIFVDDKKSFSFADGTNVDFPVSLRSGVEFSHNDLHFMDGTLKMGIGKNDWANGYPFMDSFKPPFSSYHLNFSNFSNFMLKKMEHKINIHFYEVNSKNLDADFIMDCSGKPDDMEDFDIIDSIPVNSIRTMDCFWDGPKFNYTVSIARPFGSVSLIPLNSCCRIVYAYNKHLNNLDDINFDIIDICKLYNLNLTNLTDSYDIVNYIRKKNYVENISYNGDSSFFFNSPESTSLTMIDHINRYTHDCWFNNIDVDTINFDLRTKFEEMRTIIALHYYSGSIYDTPFWLYAKQISKDILQNSLKQKNFKEMIEYSKLSDLEMPPDLVTPVYGTWTLSSIKRNFEELNLYKKLENL